MSIRNADARIQWAGATEEEDVGVDERAYSHEEVLKQLGNNTLSIAKLTDRLMMAKQMEEEGRGDELNTKLMGVLNEELETLYSDRECLYRIDAMRELLHPVA